MGEAQRCRRVDGRDNIFPGWACCQCGRYQGYQRQACAQCRHPPCYEVTPGERLPMLRRVVGGDGEGSYGQAFDGSYLYRDETDPPPSAVVASESR